MFQRMVIKWCRLYYTLEGIQGGGAQEVLKSGLGDTDQYVEEAAGSISGTSSASPSDATSL